MQRVGIIDEKADNADVPTAKTVPNIVPGLSYIPLQLEVAEDKWLAHKLGQELLDFVRVLTQLLDVMHLLKTKHLRTMTPLPHAVIQEVLSPRGKGPLFKNFDRKLAETTPCASPSVENVLNAHGFQKTPRRNNLLKAENPNKSFPYASDMLEITGKRFRPLWQSVVIEKPEELSIMKAVHELRKPKMDPDYDQMKKVCFKNSQLPRTKSETTLFSIRFLITEIGDPLGSPTPKLQRQIEMMEASHAGFRSVDEHKAYLKTLQSHWFANFFQAVVKTSLITCQEQVEAFESLARYYEMNHNSLPFAKAKLCLIVMSLPIWDIGRIETQRAVEFILENILLLPEKPLQEWLPTRNIRYAVFPPYSVEDFLGPSLSEREISDTENDARQSASVLSDFGR